MFYYWSIVILLFIKYTKAICFKEKWFNVPERNIMKCYHYKCIADDIGWTVKKDVLLLVSYLLYAIVERALEKVCFVFKEKSPLDWNNQKQKINLKILCIPINYLCV